jgi:serine/threonine-protein kinase
MAPEVYNGQSRTAGADVYSLGLVMYWLLNEHRGPFLPLPPQGYTVLKEENALKRRCSGEKLPPPLNGSKALKAIVLKACAYDRADRY